LLHCYTTYVCDGSISQRLQVLVKTMTGEKIARELISSILQANYGINSMKLLACMHDLAAANGAALRTIKVISLWFLILVAVLTCYLTYLFIRLWISLFP